MLQDIVVATQQAGGNFTIDVIGSTVRAGRLDVRIHEEQGHLWLDWKHETAEFGCAEWQGGSWSPVIPEPWNDPSWIGVEEARKVVRNRVLGP